MSLRGTAVPLLVALLGASLSAPPAVGSDPPRARDLGIPFDGGDPGPRNAITDVAGVEVGHVTLLEGTSVRTGVTAVLPRGKRDGALRQCFGAAAVLNGNGEMTGTAWLRESGLLEGPILVTNTNSVGVVRDAVIGYAARRFGPEMIWSLPIVAETWDGTLNDIYGMHVKPEHAVRAIESASAGAVPEGNVGGGTGMICYEFKGGIGTSSRRLSAEDGGWVVGILVQANFGVRHQLRIAGLPIGRELREGLLYGKESGSIIVVVATDAPLLPHQLERLARRAMLGVARTGSVAGNGSGDLFVAFSTANPDVGAQAGIVDVKMLPVAAMDPLFEATVGATEEAIINALVAARTMSGFKGSRVLALPHGEVQAILKRHGLSEP